MSEHDLRRALRLAVDQRDRALGFLRGLDTPEARELVQSMEREKAAFVEGFHAPRPLEIVPSDFQSRRDAQIQADSLNARGRVLVLESRLEVASVLIRKMLPLLVWALAHATSKPVPGTLFHPETYEASLRYVVGLRPPERRGLFSKVDALARSYPTTLGHLWLEARSLIDAAELNASDR